MLTQENTKKKKKPGNSMPQAVLEFAAPVLELFVGLAIQAVLTYRYHMV
jgi:hypothetical protein